MVEKNLWILMQNFENLKKEKEALEQLLIQKNTFTKIELEDKKTEIKNN